MIDSELPALVESRDRDALRAAMQAMHPADVADFVDSLGNDDRLFVFSLLSNSVAAEVLDETKAETTRSLVEGTTTERVSDVLEFLEAAEAAEILADLPTDDASEILGQIEEPLAQDIKNALAFEEDTAGRLMSPSFVALKASMPASAALATIRDQVSGPEEVFYAYVVDDQGVLEGVLSMRALVLAREEVLIGDIGVRDVVRVSVHADREEVAHTMAKYDLLAIPVVEDDGRLVGTVTIDDAVDVLAAEAAEDLLRISGSFEPPHARPHLFAPVFYRLPWLLVTVAGELALALVISGHADQIQRVVELAFFIPIVAATAGGVGSQSLASTLGNLQQNRPARQIILTMLREARSGLMLGALSGAITGALAMLWRSDAVLAGVIAASMTISMMVSALLGAAVPLAMHKAKVDPTIASGPLIQTVNDAVSLNIYLAIAALLLAGIR